MSNSLYVRSALAKAGLELVSPLIQGSLLDDSDFRKEYGFKIEPVIAFGESGFSIQRSRLFDAVRAILSGVSELEVTDIEGRKWKLQNEGKKGDYPTLGICSDGQKLILPGFAMLSPDKGIRLRNLDESVFDVNLPTSAQETWRSIILERPLEDDEVDEFRSDLRDTPIHMARLVRDEIETGRSTISTLVPYSRRYFDRLVGAYDGSASIRDYSIGVGRNFFEELSAWRPYDGFLFSLFLSSHSFLTAEIDIKNLGTKDLIRAFSFLETHGDRISQLGAIEVGLRSIGEKPEIEPFIAPLIEQIRDDDVNISERGMKLLSALFVLVDGELSRTRLMSAEPPFYRRLASLAQAALIHRQLIDSGVDEKFSEWAFNSRGNQYFMKSLADMRLEPRWNPELASASQMQADFFGRIMIAAKNYTTSIKGSMLHDEILGAEPNSISSLCEFPYPYLPGPLEGAEGNPNAIPADLSDTIKAQLSTDEVGPSSFVALVNSAMIFRVDLEQVELAAKALKLGNHRLRNLEDKSQLLSILTRLATVAAVARSLTLADELRIIVRRYMHDVGYRLSIDEAFRICLVASASRKDLIDWRDFCGEWLTELAFGEIKGDEGTVFYSRLQSLCHAVPELWVSCARADAALLAFNGR